MFEADVHAQQQPNSHCTAHTNQPQGVYLVADSADAADAWVDALILAQHLVTSRSADALADVLTPAPARRAKGGGGGGLRTGGSPQGGGGGGSSGV